MYICVYIYRQIIQIYVNVGFVSLKNPNIAHNKGNNEGNNKGKIVKNKNKDVISIKLLLHLFNVKRIWKKKRHSWY